MNLKTLLSAAVKIILTQNNTRMKDGRNNIYALDKFEFLFSKVSNLILHSYDEIIKNEQFTYTKIKDKYWVVLENRNENPEEYIRNVFLDKQYLQNKEFKRKFEVSDLEFKYEVGENKDRQTIGSHDIQVLGLAQKLFGEADEDIYFSIECKRLNNAKQTPSKYVNEGILRYTTNKYSDLMPIAGMIAIIEDKNLEYLKELNKILERHNILPQMEMEIRQEIC